METEFTISKLYEEGLNIQKKKENGIYYTPEFIVDYIIENTIKKHDIIKNPSPKILDISCGCGNFLIKAYDALYDLIESNLYDLKDKYGDEYFRYDNIHNYIISKCIYGYDIDEDAIEILKEILRNKDIDLEIDNFNIYCRDSLKEDFKEEFDYIIGNPPYIGHKQIDEKYRKFILKEYSEVYQGKSDIYFCFYKKILDILHPRGVASLITPRYFLESVSAIKLRKYIDDNAYIDEIVDFFGEEVFEKIGVSSCIVTMTKQKNSECIKVLRPKEKNIFNSDTKSLKEMIEDKYFKELVLNKDLDNDEWLIIDKEDKKFYENIQNKSSYKLGEICTSFQGIITGCDRAFVLDSNSYHINHISEDILKPWIKNKDVQKFKINTNKYKLIYSNDIQKEDEYPYEIELIKQYRNRLINRRECKKGTRKWYQLQWGRDKALFERSKIMYPYKSCENRFAIDYNNSFCSADVYSFFIKDKYINDFSHEYLIGILNSSIYDKYFKINAKKMDKNNYDYYPNKVMQIKIFKDDNYEKIEALSKKILINIDNKEIVHSLQSKIDKLIKISLDI